MAMAFKTYKEAFNAAVERANRLNQDQGIEYFKYDRSYVVSGLLMPKHRRGWELQVQVVSPGEPKIPD